MKKMNKAMLTLVVLMALVGSTVFVAPTARAATIKTEKYTITRDGVNVRKGPGTDSEKLGTLKKGQVIEVFSTVEHYGEEWYAFLYNKKVGYVINWYAHKKAKTVKNNVGANKVPKVLKYTITSPVNFRNKPSMDSIVITTLAKGTVIPPIEIKNGWTKAKIKVRGKQTVGYFATSYSEREMTKYTTESLSQKGTRIHDPLTDRYFKASNLKEFINAAKKTKRTATLNGTKQILTIKIKKGVVYYAIDPR